MNNIFKNKISLLSPWLVLFLRVRIGIGIQIGVVPLQSRMQTGSYKSLLAALVGRTNGTPKKGHGLSMDGREPSPIRIKKPSPCVSTFLRSICYIYFPCFFSSLAPWLGDFYFRSICGHKYSVKCHRRGMSSGVWNEIDAGNSAEWKKIDSRPEHTAYEKA